MGLNHSQMRREGLFGEGQQCLSGVLVLGWLCRCLVSFLPFHSIILSFCWAHFISFSNTLAALMTFFSLVLG